MNYASVKLAGLTLAILSLGACQRGPAAPVPAPSIQYQSNPYNVPGYVSPCAGGQPGMQYNCPQGRN